MWKWEGLRQQRNQPMLAEQGCRFPQKQFIPDDQPADSKRRRNGVRFVRLGFNLSSASEQRLESGDSAQYAFW
jgi:hypothetical protein